MERRRKKYPHEQPYAVPVKRKNALGQGLARADNPALMTGLDMAHAIAERRENSSQLAMTPAELVRWLRLPSALVLKSPRMFRDAEEWWSFDHSAASSEDHPGARSNWTGEPA